jgi:hypothetical protein
MNMEISMISAPAKKAKKQAKEKGKQEIKLLPA